MRMEPATSDTIPPRTWSNVFSGLLWFAIGFTVITGAQIVVATAFGLSLSRQTGTEMDERVMQRIFLDGDLVGFAFPLAFVALAALVLAAIHRRGRQTVEYLALKPVSPIVLARWAAVTLLLMLFSYVIGLVSGRPDIPEWLEAAYPTVDHAILFGFSIVLVGPLLEEMLYRGYILKTWLESRLSRTTTIVLLSLLWTVTHLQYDVYDMLWIFILGLALAYARVATGSLYPPLLMHMLWNGAALMQLEWYFAHQGSFG